MGEATATTTGANRTGFPSLRPVGLDGLLVAFGDGLDVRVQRAVLAFRAAAEAAAWPGVEETAPSLTSVLLRFDPLERRAEMAGARLRWRERIGERRRLLQGLDRVIHRPHAVRLRPLDLGDPGRALLEDADPPEAADAVVMESTYGDRDHRPRRRHAPFAELRRPRCTPPP